MVDDNVEDHRNHHDHHIHHHNHRSAKVLLFNVATDPGEREDLSSSLPELREELVARVEKLRITEVPADDPTEVQRHYHHYHHHPPEVDHHYNHPPGEVDQHHDNYDNHQVEGAVRDGVWVTGWC